MKILLNADDFGYDDDTVAATIECFERGALTSATIMPNMPATASAIRYARAHPELSFGIHLTFGGNDGERPLSDPARIPDLVRPNGELRDGRSTLTRATLRRLPAAPVRIEMEAQLQSLVDRGVRISHVDSHGHLHKAASFVAVMREVLPKFGLDKVRRGQNVWFRKPLTSPTFWTGGVLHPRISRWFHTTDRFFMPTRPGEAASLARLLESHDRGTLEVGVHPGYREAWRDDERDGVQEFARRIARSGHELSSWSAL